MEMRLVDQWELAFAQVGEKYYSEDERLAVVVDAGVCLYESYYCECCGPMMNGGRVTVRWEDTGKEEDICLQEGDWDGTPLYEGWPDSPSM